MSNRSRFRWAWWLLAYASLGVGIVGYHFVAGLDWFINMWGFGTLTVFAGWSSTGVPVDRVGLTVLLAFCPLFAGLYPLTQLYQLDEDRRRGDRTLATGLGARNSLALSLLSVGIAFLMLLQASLSPGVRPGATMLLGIAALAWLSVLWPWLRRVESLSPPRPMKRSRTAGR